ncbi:MAG TPA: MarR family transcriptional regulator, partial [Nocardioides sp.]|nr:MarR family transcriptional regulator [Nocardioides sp.]
MPTTFGPQLIGQTEKTLNALLDRVLAGRLSEPEWVTLRLAHQVEAADDAELARVVADRARFADAADVVRRLARAGLVLDGRP